MADLSGGAVMRAGLLQRLLYQTPAGRCALRVLVSPAVSELAGRLCDSTASKTLVKPFAVQKHIDLEECEKGSFFSFNDFFTRKLKPGCRPVEPALNRLISPADGYAAAYPIGEHSLFIVKSTPYTVRELLDDAGLADGFLGGFCFVIRLVPHHYHRFIYVDSGVRECGRRIEGKLHTVHPIAHDTGRFFATNTREFTVLHTERFGQMIQMEVGAMMVGRIVNLQTGRCAVRRGQEKGYFEFGGSTVLLLLKQGAVEPDEALLAAGRQGAEVAVRQGQGIGRAVRAQ